MNATTTNAAIPTTTAQTLGISRLVRRIHMFTGLFLAPWMIMYALSTLVMAHHESVNSFYGSKSPILAKERELDYSRSFPTNLTRDAIAQQILSDLGMEARIPSVVAETEDRLSFRGNTRCHSGASPLTRR
jgi:hypothetical protein